MKESVSSKEPFNQLFSPGRIGKMILRNRLVMPPMETNYGKGQGFVRDQHRAYYEARAKGGVGLIIVEAICVDRLGSLLPGNLIMDGDAYIPAMAELVRSIQKHGARAAAQLCHGGALASREIIGVQPAGPSASKNFKGDISREMTLQEISDQIHLFANAAARAKRAGFDAVEIHGATSYLIAQFLSGYWNRRKDQYGGPLENRARFLIQVIQASRAAVGEDFPVWCRINGGEFGLEGGTTLEEAKQVAKWAEAAGSDSIHVSSFGGGSQSYMGPPVVDPNVLIPLAQEIKKGLSIPVIAVGRITLDQGEKALAEGKVDFIAIGRGVIADPDLPNKLFEGRSEDIRPCIGCQECISRIMFKMEPLRCTVNALCGWEEEYGIEPAPTPKKIIIIGGGPGGLEAARVAALRGHLVSLFEKEPQLGGLLVAASRPPKKGDIERFLNYLKIQIEELGIEVNLSREINPEEVAGMRADGVIIACGTLPLIPAIKGLDSVQTIKVNEALLGKHKVGQKVLIIGGGMAGSETADYFSDQGKEVIVIEILEKMAVDMVPVLRRALLDRLKKKGVAMLVGVKGERIEGSQMIIEDPGGKRQAIRADTFILATGGILRQGEWAGLKTTFGDRLFFVGDMTGSQGILEAISQGNRVGRII